MGVFYLWLLGFFLRGLRSLGPEVTRPGFCSGVGVRWLRWRVRGSGFAPLWTLWKPKFLTCVLMVILCYYIWSYEISGFCAFFAFWVFGILFFGEKKIGFDWWVQWLFTEFEGVIWWFVCEFDSYLSWVWELDLVEGEKWGRGLGGYIMCGLNSVVEEMLCDEVL